MLSNKVMHASGVASFVAALSGADAVAVETLAGSELVESCQAYAEAPGSAEGALCRGYLQGLLAAADTDMEGAAQSSLVRRATETRASHLVTRVEDATSGTSYCLPQNTSVDIIIEHLVRDSSDGEFSALPAEMVVASTLARHFPCGAQR